MAVILGSAGSSLQAAGFRMLEVDDPGQPALTVGLWYPSEQAVSEQPNTPFERSVALDAPVGSTNGALIVISHGFGGWVGSHADTAEALADAGFMVAAPTHTGNTWSDMSSPIEKWTLDRPRHVSETIDYILGFEDLRQLIDPDKVGVYGFSAGAYTALGLVGGVPDFDRAASHCMKQPQEFVCAEGMIDAMLAANMAQLPSSAWGADERIKAAVIAAPGLGFTYSAETLSNVSAEIQLWSGQLDESVPYASNGQWLAEQLPDSPESHIVDKANHFAFMIVNCREAFKEADPEEYKVVCGDAEGFDRYEFHHQMHEEMIRFFDNSLSVQ